MTHSSSERSSPHSTSLRRWYLAVRSQGPSHPVRSRARDLAQVEHQLMRLTRGAYMVPPRSVMRQKLLTELIQLATAHLWRDRSKAEAVHHVLHYVTHNLNRVAAYEWQTGIHASFIDGFEADCCAYRPDRSPVAEPASECAELNLRKDAIVVYITADPYGDWSRTHLPGRPHISCQLVTLQRLQHHASWDAIANDLNVSAGDLAAFFQQQCLPKLRQLPL